jgi:hypothetical protein
MPFKSAKQEKYLWANHPEVARRWTEEHGSYEQSRNSHFNLGKKDGHKDNDE